MVVPELPAVVVGSMVEGLKGETRGESRVVGGHTICLTTGIDTGTKFTGTDNNDTFTAVINASAVPGEGTSLNAGDSLVGNGGADTLSIIASAGNNTATGFFLKGIEKVSVQAASAAGTTQQLDMTNASGVETLVVTASTGDAQFNNLANIVDTEITNSTGTTTTGYQAAVVAGSADVAEVTLNGAAGSADAAFVANGIEKFNVVATGANTGNATNGFEVTLAGAQLKELAISGDKNAVLASALTAATNNSTATAGKVDASTATGNLDIDLSGAANNAGAAFLNVTAGKGDDTVRVATLNTNMTIAGGDGTDTLRVTALAGGSNDFKNVSGFEKIAFAATVNAAQNLANAGTINEVTLVNGSTGAGAISGVSSGVTLNYVAAAGGADAFGVTVNNATTSTADVVNVNVGSATTVANIAAGTLTVGGVETINITSNSKAEIAAGNHSLAITDAALKTLTVSGNESLTLTSAGTTALTSVDASKATANVNVSGLALNATAVTVTGGSGNDSISGAAGNDSLVGGEGRDTISGGGGNDVIDGGAGNDTLITLNGGDIKGIGGDGNDRFVFNAAELTSKDTVEGGAGTNVLALSNAGGALTDASFTNVTGIQTITASAVIANVSADGNDNTNGTLSMTLNSMAQAAGVTAVSAQYNATTGATTGSNAIVATVQEGFTNALTFTIANDGVTADNINAGATTASITINGKAAAFDANDTLVGGSGANDSIVISADGNGTGANLSKMSGFETVTVNAGTAGTETAKITIGSADVLTSGKSLKIDASVLTNDTAAFTFDGSAETQDATAANTGRFNVTSGAGADTITGGAGNDTVNSGANADVIYGNAGNDTINTEAGNDYVDGGAGNDTIDGGTGNDTVYGGAGTDSLTGGEGNDTYVFAAQGDSAMAGTSGTNATSFTGDTIVGFNAGDGTQAGAVDKLSLPWAVSTITTVTIGSASIATFQDDLATNGNLTAALTGEAGKVAVVTVSGGTAAGTYLIMNNNAGAYSSANTLLVKLQDAQNLDKLSTYNFGGITPTMTATVDPASTLTLAGTNFGAVNVNLTSATAGGVVTDSGTAVALTETATYVQGGITALSASGLANGTAVTVTVQQADAAGNDYTGAWYTSAGGTDTLALKDAGDYSALSVTNFDAVTLTTANGGVTMAAANLTGKTLAFTTDNAIDDITITATQAAAATTDLSNLTITGGGALEMTASSAGDYSGIKLGNVSKITTGSFDGALTFASTDVTGKTIAFLGNNTNDDINVTVAQAAAATTNLSGLSISGGGEISAVFAGNGNYAGINLGTGVSDVNIVAAGGTVAMNSADITGKTLTVTGDAAADILKVSLAQADAAAFNSGLTAAGGAVLELSVSTGDYSALDAADIDYTVVRTDQANGVTIFAAKDFDGKTVAFTTDNAADVVALTVGATDGAMNLSNLSVTGAGSIRYVLTGAGTYTEELEITNSDDFAGITAIDASQVNGAAIISSASVTGKTLAITTDSASDQFQIVLAQADVGAVDLSNITETGDGSLELNVVSGDYSGLGAGNVVFSKVNTNGADSGLTFAAEDFSTKTVSFVTDNAGDVVSLTVAAGGGAALTLAGLTETGAGSLQYNLAAGDYAAELLAEAFTNISSVKTSDHGGFTFAGSALTGKTVVFTTDDNADVMTIVANTTAGSNDYTNVTETGGGSMVLSLATATNYGTIVGANNFASVNVGNVAAQVNLGSAGSVVNVTGPANHTFTVSGSSLDTFNMANTTNGGDVFNGLTTGDKITFDVAASGIIKDAGGNWDGIASAGADGVGVTAEGNWFWDNAADLLYYYNAVTNATETISLIGVTSVSTDAGSFVVSV